MEKERTLISRTGTYSDGFTLLELIVVVFIIGLTFILVFPSIRINSGLRSEANRLASVLRYLNDTSITTKNSLRLRVYMNQRRIEYESPEGMREERFHHLEYVETPSRGIIRDSDVTFMIKPSGLREEIRFSLLGDNERFYVILNPFSNRVVVRKDEKYK